MFFHRHSKHPNIRFPKQTSKEEDKEEDGGGGGEGGLWQA